MYDHDPTRRQEHAFWTYVKCPTCQHANGLQYLPDLLKGPREVQCASASNPYSTWHLTPHSFGLALDDAGKDRIVELLQAAGRMDHLLWQAKEIERRLGHQPAATPKEETP